MAIMAAGEGAVDELLAAVERLPPERLHEFARRFAEWREKSEAAHEDAALVQSANARLPSAEERALRRLTRRSEQGTLTAEELTEYQALARRAEEINVLRAEALAELVRRRGRSAQSVMREIGWQAGSDGP